MNRRLLVIPLLILAGCAQQPRISQEECQQMRAQLADQQRLQRDNARRIDELQKLAAERLRHQREEQRRADDLQQKLDALRSIERELHSREPRR